MCATIRVGNGPSPAQGMMGQHENFGTWMIKTGLWTCLGCQI